MPSSRPMLLVVALWLVVALGCGQAVIIAAGALAFDWGGYVQGFNNSLSSQGQPLSVGETTFALVLPVLGLAGEPGFVGTRTDCTWVVGVSWLWRRANCPRRLRGGIGVDVGRPTAIHLCAGPTRDCRSSPHVWEGRQGIYDLFQANEKERAPRNGARRAVSTACALVPKPLRLQ